jgi:hypothetical protein
MQSRSSEADDQAQGEAPFVRYRRCGEAHGQGTRVTPESQRRGIQRDEDEHEAEELENAIAAEMAPRTAHNA